MNVTIIAVGLGMIVIALIAAGPQIRIDSLELLGFVALVVGVPLLLNQFSATNGSDHPNYGALGRWFADIGERHTVRATRRAMRRAGIPTDDMRPERSWRDLK